MLGRGTISFEFKKKESPVLKHLDLRDEGSTREYPFKPKIDPIS
jgi:hypothetical protein